MSRYIDADKLKERINLVSVDAITLYEMGINAGLHRAEAEIEMQPTVDVRADTVREFAEKVNSCFCPDCDYSGYEIREVIDQTAKELLESEVEND